MIETREVACVIGTPMHPRPRPRLAGVHDRRAFMTAFGMRVATITPCLVDVTAKR